MCSNWMKTDNQIGIYIHIPFCVRKCAYCDFLSFSADSDTHNKYVNSLCKQIGETVDKRQVSSVYIGGGTPSVINPELIVRILCKLRETFVILPQAEITIEVNPGTVDINALSLYKEAGINRLSIGLQSADDKELKMLGRIHTFDDFIRTYDNAVMVGFDNINVDIMTALPNQTETVLTNTLDTVIGLKPKHISAYSLIIEDGTPFYDKYGNCDVMDTEEERKLYYLCRNKLRDAGYEHYEISNFAKPGYQSRHNTSYWIRQDYYGFGLGASSLVCERRLKNETDIKRYIENPHLKTEEIVLGKNDQMEEFMFLGLRMMKGVSIPEFEQIFQIDFESVYGEVTDKLLKEGLLDKLEYRLFLTDKGIDYGNYVFSKFLL